MKNYQKLSKKALSCMYVSNSILSVILLIVSIIGVYFTWDFAAWRNLLLVVIVLIVVESIVFPKIRYSRYKYSVTEEDIDVIEGIFWVSRDIVPIERIHKIEVNKGPIDRLFGLGKVVVVTAGGSVVLRFIEDEVSEDIAMRLKNLINQIVSEEEVSNIKVEERHGDE